MEIKDIAKKMFKLIIKSNIFIISIIVVIIFLIFFPSAVYYITVDDGTYSEDDWESTPYVASRYTGNTSVTSNGIQCTSSAQELWDEAIENGNNIEEYLDSPEELEKLMNAELVTQYPKIGGNGNLDGVVEFKRNKNDETNSMLTYIELDTFNSYINNKDLQALNYFTLDENKNVVIAVVNETIEELKGNDSEMIISEYSDTITDSNRDGENSYKKTDYDIRTETINYKNYIQGYTMPFQYLWALLVVGEDKDFVLELAELVSNSQIIISIYDNVTTTVNEDIFTYKKESRTDTYVKVEPEQNYEVEGYPSERYWVGEGMEHYDSRYPADYSNDETEYTIRHRFTYKNNNPTIDLTYADVWIKKVEKPYTYQNSDNETQEDNERELEDTDYEEMENSPENSSSNSALLQNEKADALAREAKEYIEENLPETNNTVNNDSSDNNTNTENVENVVEAEEVEVVVNVSYVECSYYQHRINRKQKTTEKTTDQRYIAGSSVTTEKVDKNSEEKNFVNILCSEEYKDAKDKIIEVSDWLFEILESNDDTKNKFVELTKYLLYKATDVSYGVDSYDFSTYDESNFNTADTSTSDQLIRYIHSYEGALISEDGTMYIVEDVVGNPTVGYGVDLVTSGYKSLFDEAGYSTNVGDAIPVDFVDSIERMEIEAKKQRVIADTTGLELTPYQIDALISRAYNWSRPSTVLQSTGVNFLEAYNEHWNQERDDRFNERNNNADYNHSLYTKYMKYPITGGGRVLQGLINRRNSEWKLFQTGYYDRINEWYVERGSSVVETARKIHEYMEINRYSYCVNNSNRYEECGTNNANGSNHGLDTTFEKSKTGYKHSCCATYVSWVLQECGYLLESEHTNSANGLQSILINKNWIRISSESELQPGDVLCWDHHVEIYGGNNRIYNAGSGNAIRNAVQTSPSFEFNYALRAPN